MYNIVVEVTIEQIGGEKSEVMVNHLETQIAKALGNFNPKNIGKTCFGDEEKEATGKHCAIRADFELCKEAVTNIELRYRNVSTA